LTSMTTIFPTLNPVHRHATNYIETILYLKKHTNTSQN